MPKTSGKRLAEDEEIFITPQREFIALEMIEDTVKTLVGEDLENYLHSEPEK